MKGQNQTPHFLDLILKMSDAGIVEIAGVFECEISDHLFSPTETYGFGGHSTPASSLDMSLQFN